MNEFWPCGAPAWSKKAYRSEDEGKRAAVAAGLGEELAERMTAAMQTVGLSGSDLCRVGLLRVIADVERNGFLEVGCREPADQEGAR